MKVKCLTTLCTISLLTSCGGTNPRRYHEKQRSPTAIKINHLNLGKKQMQMRIEYRNYVEKTLENLSCQFKMNNSSDMTIEQQPHLKFGAFSTEILNFGAIQFNNSETLNHLKSIEYSLDCILEYDKGSERVIDSSVLYLTPGTDFQYR
jgi:hypothetical protein